MVIIFRFKEYLDAINSLLILSILQYRFFLLSDVTFHLYFLVQITYRGFCNSLCCNKLLHLSYDIAQELLSKPSQSWTRRRSTFIFRLPHSGAAIKGSHLLNGILLALITFLILKPFDSKTGVTYFRQSFSESLRICICIKIS